MINDSNTPATDIQAVNDISAEKVISTPFPTPTPCNSGNSQVTPFNTHSTDYQKVKLPMPKAMHTPCTPRPRIFEGHEYYGAEDVAKIIGVNRTTVLRWQNELYMGAPQFQADTSAHDGRYLYDVERVMQLKSVYRANWTRSSYEPTPADDSDKKIMPVDTATSTAEKTIDNCVSIVPRKAEFVQQLENLPQEILSLRRFLETRKDNPKRPVISDWQNPKNQKFYSELKGIVGFVAATEQAGGLVMYDFDHCRNPDGSFVNEDAERWFNYLNACEEYFCESSVSDEGLHMFGQPTTGKFGKINLRLYFTEDKKSYLEVFYSSTRFCLCTGKPFRCKPNAPIAQGEVADEQLQTILDEIQRRTPVTIQEPKKASHEFSTTDAAFDSFRLERMLVVIPPENLSFNEWFTVLSSCFNLGMSYPNFDAWCRRDTKKNPKGEPRYNELENRNHWANRIDPAFGFGQLYNIAIRYGYDAKKTTKEYYDMHPELSKHSAEQPARADDGERTQDKISSCPVNLLIPAGYDFNFHGITYLQPSRRDDGKIRRVPVTRTPMLVTKIFCDPMTFRTRYEVSMLIRNKWRTIETDGRTLSDQRKILELAEYGAGILEPKLLCRYFTDIISINDDFRETKSYSQTGWTDDDCEEFASPINPDYVIRRNGYDYEKIFKPKGDADKWREKFSEAMKQGGEIAHVVMGTAAAAFLVRPFGLPNLQVHLHGKRSIGKTPLLRFVVSAFGDTGEKGLYYTFGATSPKSRIELACAFRDMPLIGEEIESLSKRDAEKLPQDIYNYSLGIGGQVLTKLGNLREPKIFSGARITDGEHEITQANGNGGELKRVLQLRAKELLDEDFAVDLHGFCDRNHGLFLEQWIRYIKAHRDEIARDYHEALKVAKHMQKRDGRENDNTQLTMLIIATVAFQHFKICIGLQDAVDLAEQASDRINIVKILPTAADIDDTTRALDFLQSFVAGSGKYFWRTVKNETTGKKQDICHYNADGYGKIFDDGEIAFLPHALKMILEEKGKFTSADKIISEFYDSGYLRTANGKKTYPSWIDGETKRTYRFKAGTLIIKEIKITLPAEIQMN